jgi:uncharacterized protein YndB with AHSA1/START domain
MSSDRIEKVVTLAAPVARVWRAIADSREFGSWFGVTLDGPFEPGRTLRGTWGTFEGVDFADIQRRAGLAPHPVHLPEGASVFCTVERVEPERLLSFRWIPFGIDAAVDPVSEPTTLVEFRLEPVREGTRLVIAESGFDRVPAHRRERAFRMNTGGWEGQAENLRRYLENA